MNPITNIASDHGELNHTDFGRCGTVFTGHFHKRQERDNVVYTGNFPATIIAMWDDESRNDDTRLGWYNTRITGDISEVSHT